MSMEYKTLYDGTKIPALGLGTWQIGGRNVPDYSKDSENITAMKNALELGYTLIDTAEMYGAGHTEELIATAIEGYNRDKLFIVSKVMPEHLSYEGVIKAAEGSLRRLKTDYLDLYLIHFPNNGLPNDIRGFTPYKPHARAGPLRRRSRRYPRPHKALPRAHCRHCHSAGLFVAV